MISRVHSSILQGIDAIAGEVEAVVARGGIGELKLVGLAETAVRESVSRIQAVMRAKQAEPSTRAYRIVGQAHGHNFLPGRSCAECEKVKECKVTSAFISSDDRTWSKAVFNQQPWHVCQIFGHNARGEKVHAFYGLQDNRLSQRGFHAIRDFDPRLEANNHTDRD